MKATIEVPDELYRRVKARSALLGRSVREVTTELYQQWLSAPSPARPPEEDATSWIDGWVSMGVKATEGMAAHPTTRELLEDDRRRLDPRA